MKIVFKLKILKEKSIANTWKSKQILEIISIKFKVIKNLLVFANLKHMPSRKMKLIKIKARLKIKVYIISHKVLLELIKDNPPYNSNIYNKTIM